MPNEKMNQFDIALERLLKEAADQVMQETDEEILQEAKEEYGDLVTMRNAFDDILESAYRDSMPIPAFPHDTKVLEWPLKIKEALMVDISQRFAGELTAAARNGGAGEEDINFEIKQWIELGVIDEHGRYKS